MTLENKNKIKKSDFVGIFNKKILLICLENQNIESAKRKKKQKRNLRTLQRILLGKRISQSQSRHILRGKKRVEITIGFDHRFFHVANV